MGWRLQAEATGSVGSTGVSAGFASLASQKVVFLPVFETV